MHIFLGYRYIILFLSQDLIYGDEGIICRLCNRNLFKNKYNSFFWRIQDIFKSMFFKRSMQFHDHSFLLQKARHRYIYINNFDRRINDK